MKYHHVDFKHNNFRDTTEDGVIWLINKFKEILDYDVETKIVKETDINSTPLTEEDFHNGPIVMRILLKKFIIPIGYERSLTFVTIKDWNQWEESLTKFAERNFTYEVKHWFSEKDIITLNTKGWNGKI